MDTEYVIVRNVRTDLMEAKVKEHLAAGWELHGFPFSHGPLACQAMIRTPQAAPIVIPSKHADSARRRWANMDPDERQAYVEKIRDGKRRQPIAAYLADPLPGSSVAPSGAEELTARAV
jgi:hypothetical protein